MSRGMFKEIDGKAKIALRIYICDVFVLYLHSYHTGGKKDGVKFIINLKLMAVHIS